MAAVKLGAGALRELRIHLCQKSAASNGVRAFIENDYLPLKRSNMDFPILIRECSGINPRIWARYEYGVEKSVSLVDSSREDVAKIVRDLASQTPGRRPELISVGGLSVDNHSDSQIYFEKGINPLSVGIFILTRDCGGVHFGPFLLPSWAFIITVVIIFSAFLSKSGLLPLEWREENVAVSQSVFSIPIRIPVGSQPDSVEMSTESPLPLRNPAPHRGFNAKAREVLLDRELPSVNRHGLDRASSDDEFRRKLNGLRLNRTDSEATNASQKSHSSNNSYAGERAEFDSLDELPSKSRSNTLTHKFLGEIGKTKSAGDIFKKKTVVRTFQQLNIMKLPSVDSDLSVKDSSRSLTRSDSASSISNNDLGDRSSQYAMK